MSTLYHFLISAYSVFLGLFGLLDQTTVVSYKQVDGVSKELRLVQPVSTSTMSVTGDKVQIEIEVCDKGADELYCFGSGRSYYGNIDGVGIYDLVSRDGLDSYGLVKDGQLFYGSVDFGKYILSNEQHDLYKRELVKQLLLRYFN